MFEVDHGQPCGRTTDRPPYRGGLSATTKQWISLRFTSILKCELIYLMLKDAHDDMFNLLIHIHRAVTFYLSQHSEIRGLHAVCS